jgi:hypothetical protein
MAVIYPRRYSRHESIAWSERGQDYPVHAGREVPTPLGVRARTACGRWLYSPNEHPADHTLVSCRACLRVTGGNGEKSHFCPETEGRL